MISQLELIERKIVRTEDYSRLKYFRSYLKYKKQQLVFTNGCFDLIHRGHIDYLSKARDLGDVMVVGLNTDASVRRLKGDTRPIKDEWTRAMLLGSFRFVDLVVLFDEDTPLQLIKTIEPNILVKGSDYEKKDIVGADYVESIGGRIERLNFLEGFSSTGIIKKITDNG